MDGNNKKYYILFSLIIFISFCLFSQNNFTFMRGYTGNPPIEKELRPDTHLKDKAVWALLLNMKDGSISIETAKELLNKSSFTIDDLIRSTLIKVENGQCKINCLFFTANDVDKILFAVKKYGKILVEDYISNKAKFNKLYKNYKHKSVSIEYHNFIVIGAFSLDWDGLKKTLDWGYRDINADKDFSFWVAEKSEKHDFNGFYWGTTAFPVGKINFKKKPIDFAFMSFGDPNSYPRFNLPDLLYTPKDKLPKNLINSMDELTFNDDNSFGQNFQNVIGLNLSRDIGSILFSIRNGANKIIKIEKQTNLKLERINAILKVLNELQYIEIVNSKVNLIAPVYENQDKKMINNVTELSKKIIKQWLDTYYYKMKQELQSFTTLKHGITYETLYTRIWHYIFGYVNKQLVKEGFFKNPYDDNINYKGSLVVTWKKNVFRYLVLTKSNN